MCVCNSLRLTHSSVSFLLSILATTSRSSLAFSSLDGQTNRQTVSQGGPAPARRGAGTYLYREEAS